MTDRMTNPNPEKGELPEYDFDLVFDETECGGTGAWSYFGLPTDLQTVSNILVRIETRGDPDANFTNAKALSEEVVKRWNAYNTRTQSPQPALAMAEVVAAYEDLSDFFDVDDGESLDEDSIGWQGDGELPTTFGQIRRLKRAIAAIKAGGA